jgi:hypothetical protein
MVGSKLTLALMKLELRQFASVFAQQAAEKHFSASCEAWVLVFGRTSNLLTDCICFDLDRRTSHADSFHVRTVCEIMLSPGVT